MTYKKITLSALVGIVTLMGTAQAMLRPYSQGNQQIQGRIQVALQENLEGQDAVDAVNAVARRQEAHAAPCLGELRESICKGALALTCTAAGAGLTSMFHKLEHKDTFMRNPVSNIAILSSLSCYGALTFANLVYKPTKRTRKETVGKKIFESVYFGLGIAAVAVCLKLLTNQTSNPVQS